MNCFRKGIRKLTFAAIRNVGLMLLFCMALKCQAQVSLNVVDFGAVGNGSTVNTIAIQEAIDSCFNAGGGEVLIPAGDFKSNTLVLKSEVTLRIEGVLIAITGLGNYPEMPFNQPSWSDTYTTKSLIFAEEAHNIRITGGGTIKCSGQDLSILLNSEVKPRPHGIRMHKCVGVMLDSIRLVNAPQWMVHIQRCDSVHIHDVSIYNQGFGSNDGINIDACRHVLIEDCDVDSNDDPIVIKSHSEDETSDVLVRRCTVATFERAVKVGNESLGAFRNIRFEDITVNPSSLPPLVLPQTAIYLAIADGGSADSISFERITINAEYQTPIFIRLNNRGNSYNGSDPPVQFLRNVVIRDVVCTSASTIPCSITAIPGYYVENVLLQNIQITVPGGGSSDVVPVPELEGDRPENDMWGEILPAHGFYVRHARNITFDNVCFSIEGSDPRAEYWMEDTMQVAIINDCDANAVAEYSSELEFSLYPNPTTSSITIASKANHSAGVITVVSITGQEVLRTSLNSNRQTVNTSELCPGLYYLSIRTMEGMTTQRFEVVR